MTLATIVATGLAPLVPTDAAIPAPPAGRVLRVTIPDQRRTSWCWAAVALGIADAYGDTGLSQCFYAANAIGPHCCVVEDDGCNMSAFLSVALGLAGHDHFGSLVASNDWEFIVGAVGAGTPLIAYLRNESATTGHFVVVHGYEIDARGIQFVFIGDSKSTTSKYPLTEFTLHYESDGSWIKTYQTKGLHRVPEV